MENKKMDDGVDLLDLLIIIAAQKKFIFKTIFLSIVLSAAYALLATPIYKSTLQIVPPLSSGSSASGALAMLSGSGLGDFAGMLGVKTPADLIVGVAKSEIVLDKVIDKNDLMSREEEKGFVSQKISEIKILITENLQKIFSPKQVASSDVVLRVDVREELAKTMSVTFDKLSGIISISVSDTSPDMAARLANSVFEETVSVLNNVAITPAGQQRIFLEEQLKESQKELSVAEQKLVAYQKLTGIVETGTGANAKSPMVEGLAALQGQLIAKEVELRTARRFATSANPQVKKLEAEYEAIKRQFEQDLEKIGTSPISGIGVGGIPEAAAGYAGVMREYRYREAMWQTLLKQYEMTRMTELNEPTMIQLLSPAGYPEKKESPKRTLIVALGGFLGFALAFMGAFVRHFWLNVSESPEMAEKKQIFKKLWSGK